MNKLCITLPPFAPDYSGACSALFELGGLLVIHDASGCTGNYTGYDEPRWYGAGSLVFCSGLRELDAVLGDDEKLIRKIIRAAEDLSPRFIAVLGSPVPMVIGSDLEGIALEVESRTGIPSFGFPTTGLGYYDQGAGGALVALTKRFVRKAESRRRGRVNILGATPLDFHTNGDIVALKELLAAAGFENGAAFAMDSDLEQIAGSAEAAVNLVISNSGLALAEYFHKVHGIPYLCGLPIGTEAVRTLMKRLARLEPDVPPPPGEPDVPARVLVIHNQIVANSLRNCLEADYGCRAVQAATPFDFSPGLARPGDIRLEHEGHIRKVINGGYRAVIADPLFAQLLADGSDTAFLPLPHVAVSSKIHWDECPGLVGERIHAHLHPYLRVFQ